MDLKFLTPLLSQIFVLVIAYLVSAIIGYPQPRKVRGI